MRSSACKVVRSVGALGDGNGAVVSASISRRLKRDGDCKGGDGGAAEVVAAGAEAAVSTASIFCLVAAVGIARAMTRAAASFLI